MSHTEVSPSGETSGGADCGGVTWRQIERGILVCHTLCSLRRGDIESDRMKGARLSHTVRLADGDVESDRISLVCYAAAAYGERYRCRLDGEALSYARLRMEKTAPCIRCIGICRIVQDMRAAAGRCMRTRGRIFGEGQAERIRRLSRFPPQECREESNRFGRRRVFPRVRRRIKERAN